jgi:hypothetical protein
MYLIFTIDGRRKFAMDGRKVLEVLPAADIYRLPRQRKEVVGVIRHRDMLIPVYDFRILMPDLCRPGSPEPSHLILFYGSESMNAFLAEATESVTGECLSADAPPECPFLADQELLHEGRRYGLLNFPGIEAFLNIP